MNSAGVQVHCRLQTTSREKPAFLMPGECFSRSDIDMAIISREKALKISANR